LEIIIVNMDIDIYNVKEFQLKLVNNFLHYCFYKSGFGILGCGILGFGKLGLSGKRPIRDIGIRENDFGKMYIRESGFREIV